MYLYSKICGMSDVANQRSSDLNILLTSLSECACQHPNFHSIQNLLGRACCHVAIQTRNKEIEQEMRPRLLIFATLLVESAFDHRWVMFSSETADGCILTLPFSLKRTKIKLWALKAVTLGPRRECIALEMPLDVVLSLYPDIWMPLLTQLILAPTSIHIPPWLTAT